MSGEKRYIIAHDLGTSGNKATLVDANGTICRSITRKYETFFLGDNRVEQNPSDWWAAICACSRELLEGIEPDSVAAVALSAQMMGCLCVNKQGEPLGNSLLYSDQRALEEERMLAERIDAQRFFEITGHRISASYSIEKLMWLKRHEPALFEQTHCMLNAKDYINFKLTGRMATEPSDASATNAFDLRSGDWSQEILAAAEIGPDLLPEVVPSTSVVGQVTVQAAEASGLPKGLPVVAGAGDGICAGIGAGSVAPGSAYNYLGSSSWIAMSTTEPYTDPSRAAMTFAHAIEGLYHPCGTMQTVGSSFDWMLQQLGDQGVENPHDHLEQQIRSVPRGANGLIFLPYLLGERTPRWNSKAKGAFVGLTITHTRIDMQRAVLEGIAMNLGLIMRIFRGMMPIEEVMLLGGGANSSLWCQTLADVYGVRVKVPEHIEEATSIGAAVIAGVGGGLYKDFSAVDRFINVQNVYDPDDESHAYFRERSQLFDDTYFAVEPLYERY